MIHRIIKPFVDFLYPPNCVFCDLVLRDAREIICESCWDSIPRYSQEGGIIQELREKIGEGLMLADAFAPWEFDTKMQYLIHQLKYNHHKRISQEFGRRMHQALCESMFGQDIDLIVPVPLHKSRRRKRGYNQSELIALSLAGYMSVPVDTSCITRTVNTQSQTRLDIHQRMSNVNNAFDVANPERIRDRSVLLIDDVITTGATMNACAAQLLANGARRVSGLSVAKA